MIDFRKEFVVLGKEAAQRIRLSFGNKFLEMELNLVIHSVY